MRAANVLAVAALISIGTLIVIMARDLSFYYDEWPMLYARSLTVEGLFEPWNGHPLPAVVLVWQVLIAVFGTGSYWPFLVAAWIVHAAIVCLVYVIIDHNAGHRWALGAAVLMAGLGAGWQNLFWAFQIGSMGGVALGLTALWLAPRRPGLAAAFMTASVMSTNVGLAMLAGTVLHLLLTRPRALPWLFLPALVWGGWYLLFGSGIGTGGSPLSYPAFVAIAIAYSVAGVLGTKALALGAMGALGGAVLLTRTRLEPLHWALVATVVAFYLMTAATRWEYGFLGAMQSRYVYVVAPAILIVGTYLLSGLPSRSTRYLGPAVLTFALIGNVGLLVLGHQERLALQQCDDAHLPPAQRSATTPVVAYTCA